MSNQFYDGAYQRRTYKFPAAVLSTLAVIARFQGPAGLIGRVRGIEAVLTTGTTTNPTVLSVGNNAAVAPASVSIPVTAINLGYAMTAAEIKLAGAAVVVGTNDVELAADTIVEVDTDGGAVAGAADLYITVDWY